MLTFVLRDDRNTTLAFGQLYERYKRINLARLGVSPAYRGKGIGRALVAGLLREGSRNFNLDEYSLFVMRDNLPARKLYEFMGFSPHDFPHDAPMQDLCYYMTRSVRQNSDP